MPAAIKPELKRQFPEHPWRWRDAWESGSIQTNHKQSMIVICAMAVAWNAFSWTMAIMMLPGEWQKENYPALFILIFPLAGVGLAIAAFRSVRRHMKFGESTFQMAANPGVVGGELVGVIRSTVKLEAQAGYDATLSCIKREVTGSGKNRRKRETVLWQSMKTIRTALASDNQNETAVPVQFTIPFEARPGCPEANLNSGVSWKLEVTADVPGVDYHAEFEVPVFRTEESSADFQPDNALMEDYVHVPTIDEVYRDARLVRSESGSSLKIESPMFRSAANAMIMTLITVFWIGMTAFFAKGALDFGDPVFGVLGLLFLVVFGLVGLLFMVITADLWLWRGSTTISCDGIETNAGMAGFSKVRSINRDSIRNISFKKSMQSGTKIYHDLNVETDDGKRTCIGRRIVNEAVLRRIITDIEQVLKFTSEPISKTPVQSEHGQPQLQR